MDNYRGTIKVWRPGHENYGSEVEIRCAEDCENCMENNLLLLGDAWTKKLSDTWGGEYKFEILEVELD